MTSYSHIAHLSTSSFLPPLDLHPIYPTADVLSHSLDSSSTLTPLERTTLVNHSLSRACSFANLSLLTFLLKDERCNRWIELEGRDEDGATAVTVCIMGFRGASELENAHQGDGEESDVERELEREECVRLLVKEGADLASSDNSGWTPLHHAALLAPTSLISYLLSHGASPLALSRRKLTPLDVITAYSDIPGRESAAALLRDATHSMLTFDERQRLTKLGWRGDDRREAEREKAERREIRQHRKKRITEDVSSMLEEELGETSWGWGNDEGSEEDEFFDPSDLDDEDSDGYDEDTLPTPPDSYRTMLVYSPTALERIFQSLVPLSPPNHRKLRDPLPSQALYLHCRFAAIACDHIWLEDLIVGAMDRVEEVVMANPNDLVSLAHWLFNTTLLLHLLRCDESTSQICEILGLFGLLEEMVNVIYVLIIRIIERRLDPLIDTALLDHTPPELQDEWEATQFDGEWEGWTGLIGRVISPKKKPSSTPKGSSTPNAQSKISNPANKSPPEGKMGPPPVPGTVQGGIPISNSVGSTNSTIKASSSSGSNKAVPGHTKNTSVGLNGNKSLPTTSSRPSSPPPQGLLSASNSSTFSTIKGAIASSSLFGALEAANGPSPTTSTSNLAATAKGTHIKHGHGKPTGPEQITMLLTALHTFLNLSGINPVLVVQTFSQVMYWTACEMFNRILQRRKYLCRSRALHIGLNLGVLEEWISGNVGVGLPREVGGHFRVVRELVGWLQCLSSIDQFANLIATVQTFRHLNPLQMRRAVREYRYEVGESKMTEECLQYLAQLQKDWERQRVKMGVEALKKEMEEREGSVSSRGAPLNDSMSPPKDNVMSNSNSGSSDFIAQQAIDNLFDRAFEKALWQPAKSPDVLGELLDSRHMLPLLLPSDPMHLGALPVLPKERIEKREGGLRSLMPPTFANQHDGVTAMSKVGSRTHSRAGSQIGSRSASRASVGVRGAMEWVARTRKLRSVDKTMLQHLGDDEVASELDAIASKWKFAWDSTVAEAAASNATGTEVGEVMEKEQKREEGEIQAEEHGEPGAQLTLERPRIIKERRRASQMFEDYPI